jgi:hypothetical protein
MQVTTTPQRVERSDKVGLDTEYVSLIDQVGKTSTSSWNTWKIAKIAAAALFVICTTIAVIVAGVRMNGGGSSGSVASAVKSTGLVADEMKADTSYYNEDLSERLLKISYTTYCDEESIKAWSCHYCEQVKEFEFKEVIVYSDIKVIFGYDNTTDHMVAAFSGGTALLNFLIWSWMPAIPTDFCDNCRAQAGIIDAYLDIQTELEAAMETYSNEYPGVDWHFTGYDWGGSSASYAALKFLEYFEDNDNDATIELYTFGQTRWCNKNLAKYFKDKVVKHWRVTNQRDFYVNQPLAMLGYKHTGKTVWYKCAYADDDGEFDYEVCDSEGDCAPLRPSTADHEVYIGNQFGCTDDELNTEYMLSECGSYYIANDILPAIIDEQDEDTEDSVDCVENCD